MFPKCSLDIPNIATLREHSVNIPGIQCVCVCVCVFHFYFFPFLCYLSHKSNVMPNITFYKQHVRRISLLFFFQGLVSARLEEMNPVFFNCYISRPRKTLSYNGLKQVDEVLDFDKASIFSVLCISIAYQCLSVLYCFESGMLQVFSVQCT